MEIEKEARDRALLAWRSAERERLAADDRKSL